MKAFQASPRARRAPMTYAALAGAIIALCCMLTACQKETVVPTITMVTQYYDTLENYTEIPSLTLPEGAAPTQGITAINGELADLQAACEAQLADPTNDMGYNQCVLYPSTTECYLNLVFYKSVFTTDLNTGHVQSLVYDIKQGVQVTMDDALSMADTTQEALFAQLGEQFNPILAEQYQEHELGEVIVQDCALEGFRLGADNAPIFYLTARFDDTDPAQDTISGASHVFIWVNNEFTLYDQYAVTDLEPLVPADETDQLTPPLWNQWFFAGDEPEGGFTEVELPEDADPLVEMEQLLISQFQGYDPDSQQQESARLHSAQGDKATLLLCSYAPGGHAGGMNNLLLGTFDLRGNLLIHYEVPGDDGRWIYWFDDTNVLHLLCTNSVTYQGEESCNGAYLFRFDGTNLTMITELPEVARTTTLHLPQDSPFFSHTADLFNPEDEETGRPSDSSADPDGQTPVAPVEDFWENRKALPAPQGIELFVRTEGWTNMDPASEGVSQWTYEGFIPLTEKATQSRDVIEFLRPHVEMISNRTGEQGYSAWCQLESLAESPNYTCSDHPGATAWFCRISDTTGDEFERMVLVDPDSLQGIGIHSDPNFTLTVDGVAYPLGYENPVLQDRPYRSNHTDHPLTDEIPAQIYSQWLSADLAEGADFFYYPLTEQYRLSNICTRRSDSYTAQGIHPGSTVGELFALYPNLKREYDWPPNEIALYEDGIGPCSMTFYLDFSSAPDNAPVEDFVIRDIALTAPIWYDWDCSAHMD